MHRDCNAYQEQQSEATSEVEEQDSLGELTFSPVQPLLEQIKHSQSQTATTSAAAHHPAFQSPHRRVRSAAVCTWRKCPASLPYGRDIWRPPPCPNIRRTHLCLWANRNRSSTPPRSAVGVRRRARCPACTANCRSAPQRTSGPVAILRAERGWEFVAEFSGLIAGFARR